MSPRCYVWQWYCRVSWSCCSGSGNYILHLASSHVRPSPFPILVPSYPKFWILGHATFIIFFCGENRCIRRCSGTRYATGSCGVTSSSASQELKRGFKLSSCGTRLRFCLSAWPPEETAGDAANTLSVHQSLSERLFFSQPLRLPKEFLRNSFEKSFFPGGWEH